MRAHQIKFTVFRSVTYSLLVSALVLNCNAGMAEVQTEEILPVSTYHAPSPVKDVVSSDTTRLQAKVLMKINSALTRGTLSASEASDLKDQLNDWSNEESWFISDHLPVPQSLVQKDTQRLVELSTLVDNKQPGKLEPSGQVGLHQNVGELISSALAHDKITSLQAEKYYSRLAEIESDLETIKTDRNHRLQEISAVNQQLAKLESDIHNASHI